MEEAGAARRYHNAYACPSFDRNNMADLSVVETASIVCKSPKCGGSRTRQNLIETTVKGKAAARGWICTVCLAKTPTALPIAKFPLPGS